MILAIDVGNSQVTLGLGDASGWRASWRLATDARRTADEYGVQLAALLALDGFPMQAVTDAVVSSVVPSVTPVITATCMRLFGQPPLVIEPGTRTGMPVRYTPPGTLGTDRLIDAVAAVAQFGAPVVVVDFGTATTFNVVDADGVFIGGAIAPGVGVSAEALARAGARLSRIDLGPPADLPPLIGRNTEQAMRSGVLYGYAGIVEGVLGRIDAELGPTPTGTRPPVVATGGMAAHVAPLVGRFTAIVPDLILDGLRLVLARQRGVP